MGLSVSLISFLCQKVGVDLDTGTITEFILTGGQLVGVVVAWIGRIRKGDVNIFGVRV